MTDEALLGELKWLGVDEDNYRVIALLPMVHVAWADGRIQEKERQVILRAAREGGMLTPEGTRLLDWWLKMKPTEEYTARGQGVLVALARRRRGFGSEIDIRTLDRVVMFCQEVAEAAGGVFGLGNPVTRDEERAIAEVAMALDIERGLSWNTLLKELEDPTPV